MPSASTTVSIALATYNGARFIREQIDTLLRQTRLPNEIVVCDDQSTDDTIDILRRIAATTSVPFRIEVNPERLGYRANFMRAASLASGDQIAFSDQDDLWYPHKLETVAASFDDPDVLLAYHNAELADEAGKRLGRYVHQAAIPSRVFGRLGMNPWNNPLGFTIMFRRDLLFLSPWRLQTEDPFKPAEPLAHDQWLPVIAGGLGKIAYLADVLVDYRQHQKNVFGISLAEKKRFERVAEKLLRNMDYARLARVSQKISAVFGASQAALPPDWAAKAADAERRYAQLTECYLSRHRVYTDRRLTTRVREWRALADRGAYDGRQAVAFAQKALARDFLGGVLLGGGVEKTGAGRRFRTDYDGSLQFLPSD